MGSFFKCLAVSFEDGQMFGTDSLTGFSSKLLCDFPIIYGLFFHNWEGLTVPVKSNYIVYIFCKYSYSRSDMGILTQKCYDFN